MILDLFAGPGGWDEGARPLGLHPVGLEIDPAACATRYAAGHATWQQPVDEVTTEQLAALAGHVEGLIASPPCQDFSMAGLKAGIEGDRGRLMLEVPRWVEALRPEWVACEQVPPALPWFRRFARGFAELGYSTWCGVLNAADYGVPQTRKRAVLMARLGPKVWVAPEPTHHRRGSGGRARWVTMAEALGWGDSVDLNTGRDWKPGGTRADAQTIDCSSAPAPAVTGKSGGQWQLNPGRTDSQPNRRTYDLTEPAPTVAFGHDAAAWAWQLAERRNDQTGPPADPEWPMHRPATTIAGRGLVPDPGANTNRFNDATKSRNDGYRITPAEAATLQTFRPGYPWQGAPTSQFLQIGNAIPPLLAHAILEALLGGAPPPPPPPVRRVTPAAATEQLGMDW